MDKAIERLIELIPLPLLLATAGLFAFVWLLKEYRRLPSWAAVLRLRLVHYVCVAVVLTVSAYYGTTTIVEVFPRPFHTSERGIWIAAFENDGDGIIQSHVYETIAALVERRPELAAVRVRKTTRQLVNLATAADFCRTTRAALCVSGVYIPPGPLHIRIASSLAPGGVAQFLASYSDVASIDALITQALTLTGVDDPARATAEATSKRIEVLEDSQRALRAKLDALSAPPASPDNVAPITREAALKDLVTAERGRRRRALVIGVSSYSTPVLPRLGFAASDAKAIARKFESLWPDNSDTTILVDRAASRNGILDAMDRFSSTVGKDEQVWIYLTGHAIQREDSAVFVPYDGEPSRLLATGISFTQLSDWFTRLVAAQAVLLVDTCFSGALGGNVSRGPSSLPLLAFAKPGRMIFAASGPKDLSYERADIGHGVFTDALLRGLDGGADINADDIIVGEELFSFARNEVSTHALKAGFEQRPSYYRTGDGELVLAAGIRK